MPVSIPKSIRSAAVLLALGTCGVQIVRGAAAPPVTEPVAKDAEKSKRVAVSRVGGPDVHAPLPEAGAQVGGNGVVEPADRETKVAAQVTAVIVHPDAFAESALEPIELRGV